MASAPSNAQKIAALPKKKRKEGNPGTKLPENKNVESRVMPTRTNTMEGGAKKVSGGCQGMRTCLRKVWGIKGGGHGGRGGTTRG